MSTRVCIKCEEEKSLGEYTRKGKYQTTDTICKQCKAAYAARYRLTPMGKYVAYKADAKRSGRNFNLTFEEFNSFWQEPCFYCGSEIDTIGLDRVDNSVGYQLDNVVSCCFQCNKWKGAMAGAEFFTLIERIYLKHLK